MDVCTQERIPNVLTIAGIDPSGGAGLIADVKAISALGVYAAGGPKAPTAPKTCLSGGARCAADSGRFRKGGA